MTIPMVVQGSKIMIGGFFFKIICLTIYLYTSEFLFFVLVQSSLLYKNWYNFSIGINYNFWPNNNEFYNNIVYWEFYFYF